MSCDDELYCGTGLSNPVTKPDDPNNSSQLTASTAFGGIDVAWAYPTINPHAVSYTRLFRGISSDFNNAIELHTVTGSIFYDKLNPVKTTTYYYWIKVVSINGTEGDLVGPASANAVPIGEQTLASISSRIDKGVLAQELKSQIDDIVEINKNLANEIKDRLLHNEALQAALAAVQTANGQAATYLLSEVKERKTADSALLDALNVMAVGIGENAAAIVEEKTVRVTKEESVAHDIQTLYSETANNQAAIINEQQTRTTKELATATKLTQLLSDVAGNTSAINQEITTRATAIDATTRNLTVQISQLNDATAAAIQNEANTRVNADDALSQQIATTESKLNGNISQVQTKASTDIATVNGKVVSIGALYTVKVNVNGLVGGFGVYNDGREIQAGFDVNTFWIGSSTYDKVRPFIVSNGIVYIDSARIRDADITTLKIAGNAVTIPTTCYGGAYTGNGGFQTINSGYLYMDSPGLIYANCVATQLYGTGERQWLMRISIDGGIGMVIGGLSTTVSPVIAMSRYVSAGSHSIIVEWQGADTGIRIGNSEMFIMGAKR